jgi:hypothetical protein
MIAASTHPALDIQPGQTVTVKIVRQPASAAAVKTLTRVLSKDASKTAMIRDRKQQRARATTIKQRGGRVWEGRPARIPVFSAAVGEQGTVLASIDVIKDLNSVRRFIEVTKA